MEKVLEKGGDVADMAKQAKAYSNYAGSSSKQVMINVRKVDPVAAFPDLSQHNSLMAKVS